MPLLRARELATIVNKARISHALCAANLAEELDLALPNCPTLKTVRHFSLDGRAVGAEAPSLDASIVRQPADFADVATAADDTVLIAFTSGTTGVPKGTMHFHRDVMAICACWPPHVLKAEADDVFIGSPPLAFTYGLGGLLLFPLAIGASTVLKTPL